MTDTAARPCLVTGTVCAMSVASVSAIFTLWAMTVAFVKLDITGHHAAATVMLRSPAVAMGTAHQLDNVSATRIISARFAISASYIILGQTARYTALRMKPVVGMENATA